MRTIIGLVGYAFYGGIKQMCIAIIRNEKGKLKAYLCDTNGEGETADLQYTVMLGAKFPLEAAIIAIKENGTIHNQELFDQAIRLF